LCCHWRWYSGRSFPAARGGPPRGVGRALAARRVGGRRRRADPVPSLPSDRHRAIRTGFRPSLLSDRPPSLDHRVHVRVLRHMGAVVQCVNIAAVVDGAQQARVPDLERPDEVQVGIGRYFEHVDVPDGEWVGVRLRAEELGPDGVQVLDLVGRRYADDGSQLALQDLAYAALLALEEVDGVDNGL